MTNGILHEFRKNLKYTTAEGRDNIYRLKIVESGYFQINNRFVQCVLQIITKLSKSVQGDNNAFYLNQNEAKSITKKLMYIKKEIATELDKNSKLETRKKNNWIEFYLFH